MIYISTPSSPSYVAGVVEYLVDQGRTNDVSLTSAQIFKINTDKYIEIISSEDASETDIIVFPENTLNRQDTAVILPRENEFNLADICNNISFDENLRAIACTVQNLRKYVVINMTTKRNCAEEREEENDAEPCPNEWIFYNTNIVFNRDGLPAGFAFIYFGHQTGGHTYNLFRRGNHYERYSIFYMKFNRYDYPSVRCLKHLKVIPAGPADKHKKIVIENATFETDFGVTFGHFISFDLLFESPAMDLVNNGVKNIIFPTRWYSELPFMTAVQVQQNWAFVNDVNFLAAGANLPSVGTTGSGIYTGKSGSLASVMTGEEITKLLVHEVPKIPGSVVEMTSPIYSGAIIDNLNLYKENLDHFDYTPIVTNFPYYSTAFEFCSTFNGELFCCQFVYQTSIRNNGYTPYRYLAVVYSGWRQFNNYTYEGFKVCAIVSCENEDVRSCGKRFNNTPPQGYDVRFNELSVRAKFPTSVLAMPSTLEFNVSPLAPSQFFYEEIINGTEKNIAMRIQEANPNLLTFGIFARDFRYTNSGEVIKKSVQLILLSNFVYVVGAVFRLS